MLHVRTFYIEKDSSPGSLHSDFRIEPVSDELCRIHARLVNRGGKTVFCKLAVEAETDFKPSKYLIPCVMYNGNEYGSRNSPKGLLYQGEPWIFSYDRSGIPSCTVTEDDSNVFALFASDQTPESLRSACSLVKTDSGHFLHRIYYPVTEAPVTYSGKNEMSGRYDEWIELKPDAEFSVVCHAFRGKPEWKNYGFASVFRQAWKILKHDVPQSLSPGEVWEYGIRFISDMKVVENGKEWFCGAIGDATHAIGNHISREGLDPKLTLADIERDPKLNFFFPAKKSGGIGFTCQGFMCARLLIADALRDRARKEEPLQFAIRVLDNWLECQLPNGLILKSGQQTTDCCHMGWGIIEMARISELLTRHGMDGKRYLECARKLAGFFIRNYSPETGFGKLWSREGKCLDATGSVGGFILLGLVSIWKITREETLLECIRKAMEFYYTRDLNHFTCNAGAIDCMCVDKESAYPFFESAVELYAVTREPLFLEQALKAAYYLCSWLFCYDALYDENSEFAQIGYHTAGGTAISAEHCAIDPYAAVMTGDFMKLAQFTGDAEWSGIGQLIWRNATQAIATGKKRIWHGIERPVGSQNEGFFQTRWTKYRTDCNQRGHFNDYLGVWLSTFRLSALLSMPDNVIL